MIELFVSDIDGCLAEAYRPYDLPALATLADHAARAGDLGSVPGRPAFSLCSGRAYAYVEAMSQLLGLRTPVLFESGGGIFDPVEVRVTWHPAFSAAVEAEIEAVRSWLMSDVLPGTTMMYDYGKRTQAGIIGPDFDEVESLAPIVRTYVNKHHPGLQVLQTTVSIDVVASGVAKLDGLHWLSERLGISLAEIAYIGDTHGDIPALQAVGASFAPANATPDVQEAVQHVTALPLAEGVIEAYEWCLTRNQSAEGR